MTRHIRAGKAEFDDSRNGVRRRREVQKGPGPEVGGEPCVACLPGISGPALRVVTGGTMNVEKARALARREKVRPRMLRRRSRRVRYKRRSPELQASRRSQFSAGGCPPTSVERRSPLRLATRTEAECGPGFDPCRSPWRNRTSRRWRKSIRLAGLFQPPKQPERVRMDTQPELRSQGKRRPGKTAKPERRGSDPAKAGRRTRGQERRGQAA